MIKYHRNVVTDGCGNLAPNIMVTDGGPNLAPNIILTYSLWTNLFTKYRLNIFKDGGRNLLPNIIVTYSLMVVESDAKYHLNIFTVDKSVYQISS